MQSQNNPPGANDATLVSPRTQQGAARLIVRRADGQLKEYGLDKDEISIGRLASNDVSLPDDRSVSRHHAVIRRSNVGYVIEDQQSNNGTYVDGEKILYPFVLHNGQSIKIGANELTFTMSSAQIKAASQPEPAMAPASLSPDTRPAPPGMSAQPSSQIPTQADYPAVPAQASTFPPPPQPASPPAEPQPAFAFPQPAQPAPAFPEPAPAFPSPPQPASAFQPPQPAPAFQQPAPQPAFPQFPPPAPEPAPFQAPGFGGPQFQPQPTPGFPAPQPPAQGSGGSGMIVCQNCGQSTMANKAFCLNCGTSLAAQSAPPPQPGLAAPSPFGAPQPGFFPANPGGPPPGAPFGQPPANNPQAWPPPQPQPQPWQQPPPPAQQPWPPQPGQFGAPAPAPGPIEAVVLFSRTMRLLQPGEIRVRLTTQFAGPGMLQPGTPITVRVWSAPPDAFFLSSQWVSLRVPGPGATEEGVIQATPGRPAAPGASHQLFFLISDASGQPLQPNPAVAEIAITDQPVSPFDAQGVLRLPF